MKKLILLLLFIPLVSLGQTTTQQEQTTDIVVKSNTSVNSYTNVERDLVLSEASLKVRVPLTVNLSDYTHIALVNIELLHWGKNGGLANPFKLKKSSYEIVSEALSFSILEVKNPYIENKRQAKKDPSFLKNIKDSKTLYLSLRQQEGRGDDSNITLSIRDSKNKLLYSANAINVGLNETLSFLSDF